MFPVTAAADGEYGEHLKIDSSRHSSAGLHRGGHLVYLAGSND